MYVKERFELQNNPLYEMQPKFGYNGFGEFLYYRTYSREICAVCKSGVKSEHCHKCGNTVLVQEQWADTVTRVINGTMSIRKDWYVKNHIAWDESIWQNYAYHMAIALFKMEWMPPGRGLWAMGTDFVYERGSMALQNCGLTTITENIGDDIHWMMDALMCGVGVGFMPLRNDDMFVHAPVGTYTYVIPDTREGWCDSTKALIDSFLMPNQKRPVFDYSELRPEGTPIRGFGGVASGPAPLHAFHEEIVKFMLMYQTVSWYDSVLLKTDIANCVGKCVVAGNVRRSAEICVGPIDDVIDLKNYDKYPYREDHGWMCVSPNTWIATTDGPRQVSELVAKPFTARIGCQDRQSTGFFSGGTKKAVRVTAQGYTIDCSVDHKIMTCNGWVRAGDLIVGGDLTLNDGGIYGGDWTGNGTHNEGYVLGVLVGDGSISDDGRCHISSSNKDAGADALREKFVKCLDVLRISHGTWTMPPSKIDSEEMRLSCSGLLDLAAKYGIRRDNKTAATVEIERASSDFYRGFLQGLFDTDGSVEKLGKKRTVLGVRLSQSDLPCLQTVQRMLSRFSIQSRIVEVTGSIWSRKRCYVLTVRSQSVNQYRYTIGFTHTTKQQSLGTITANTYKSTKRLSARIDEILELPDVEMFDCTVEGIHAYDANGIYVSNSNNSVLLENSEDFLRLDEIAERIKVNGEPGFVNRKNMPYGRLGKYDSTLRPDKAIAFNPCGEQPLENKELCTLAETCPTNCEDHAAWLRACGYAAFYAATVTLLPTHRPETNAVMLRNRRIGVGIIDVAGWKSEIGTTILTQYLREGYTRIRATTKWTNEEAGVPLPLRNTTMKPGGTTPKLPGLRSSWNWPTFGYTLRRVNVAKISPIFNILDEANVPHEPSVTSSTSEIFEWPIDQSNDGKVRTAEDVGLWEQAALLVLLQREWSDNAVSNTLYFRPKWRLTHNIKIGDSFYPDALDLTTLMEINTAIPISYNELLQLQEYEDVYTKVTLEQDRWSDNWTIKIYAFDPNHEEDAIADVLSSIAPATKSVSVLPHTPKGVYAQMPEEGISKSEYTRRLANIKKIDWSKLRGSDGMDERYCTGPHCEIVSN